MMTTRKKTFYRHATALAAVLAAGAVPALAQDKAGEGSGGDYIIVTGTRVIDRTRLEAVSPIDVVPATTLRERGTTELATALAQVAPSINFPRAAMVGGSDSIRPASLRGLSPDQVLVLINGTRAHSSALLNINSSAGRGAAAVDLNTIPVTAIDRVEVLRDGASAQYGSDAIAGVVNLRLREARSGGGASITYGKYITEVDTARASRNVRDGAVTTLSGWQGLGLGSEGFLTLSGEYSKRNPTSRADIDPRLPVPAVNSRYGDPEVEQGTGYINAGLPLNDVWQLYGWAGYQYRTSDAASYYRLANDINNVSAIYPNGFLPITRITSRDLNSAVGLRGDVAGWSLDLNLSYGRNRLTFTGDSVSPTYGAASPTRFFLGTLTYDQGVAGLDVNRSIPLGAGSLNLAAGAEYRREGFAIGAGQRESYDRGPLGPTLPASQSGAVSFTGFQPANEVDVHRDNVSLYVDLEARLDNGLTLGLAARGERYSDFGSTATAKLSARYDATPWLAVRGTVSTGFRAPSLQQSWYTSTQTLARPTGPVETGTYPSVSPIAVALGGEPLDPEKSTNISGGVVLRAGAFNLTVDGYRIRIRDQLALSENIMATASPQIGALLAPYRVQAARFFINGITSTTTGLDVAGNYRLETPSAGRFDFSLNANLNHIKLNKVPTSTSVLSPAPVLYGRSRILSFEEGAPQTKVVGAVNWSLGGFGANGRVTYYDDVLLAGDVPSQDLHSGDRAIVDIELRYRFANGIALSIGADNVLDTYPRATPPASNTFGVLGFPFSSPFGFNGRYVYGRIGFNW